MVLMHNAINHINVSPSLYPGPPLPHPRAWNCSPPRGLQPGPALCAHCSLNIDQALWGEDMNFAVTNGVVVDRIDQLGP